MKLQRIRWNVFAVCIGILTMSILVLVSSPSLLRSVRMLPLAFGVDTRPKEIVSLVRLVEIALDQPANAWVLSRADRSYPCAHFRGSFRHLHDLKNARNAIFWWRNFELKLWCFSSFWAHAEFVRSIISRKCELRQVDRTGIIPQSTRTRTPILKVNKSLHFSIIAAPSIVCSFA